MDGALYRKIHGITEDLLGVSAHLAAYIDYPEEDVEEVTGPELLEKTGRASPPSVPSFRISTAGG